MHDNYKWLKLNSMTNYSINYNVQYTVHNYKVIL